ncbi:MAG: LysR family transcriptional regulator substrate-binding protein [Clostridia bacterium]|nr:LysR family transcriptional regulator substrate-binding protein [Clostridia bacterium]
MGMLVLGKADIMFVAQEEILEACSSRKYIGTVSVNCIPGIYYRILPQTIQVLKTIRDGVVLSVATAESRDIAKNISAGFAEFGIAIRGSYLFDFRDIRFTTLFQDTYQLYVGKKSPLWDRTEISYEEVRQQKYIAYREEFRRDNGGLTDLIPQKEQPEIVFRTDDLDSMKQMIATGEYAAFFPKFMAAGDFYLEHGLIRAIPVSDLDMSFEVGYLESKKYKLSAIDKVVIEALKRTVIQLLEQET